MDPEVEEAFAIITSLLTTEDTVIIRRLERRVRTSSSLDRMETLRCLQSYFEKMKERPKAIYVILLELIENLSSTRPAPARTPGNVNLDNPQSSSIEPEVQEVKTNDESEAALVCTAPMANGASNSPSTAQKRNHLCVRYERLLNIYSREIERLEEAEMELDDLENEDSTYLQLHRLKALYMKTWKKYRKYLGYSQRVGLLRETPVVFEGCKFNAINKKIENLIQNDTFPEYPDILDAVKSVNSNDSLGLSSATVTGLARQLFEKVGTLVKRRRKEDFVFNFGCHLTDDVRADQDPILNDETLRKHLFANTKLGKENMNKELQKYVEMQETLMANGGLEAEVAESMDEEKPCTSFELTKPQPSADDQSEEGFNKLKYVEAAISTPKEEPLPAPVPFISTRKKFTVPPRTSSTQASNCDDVIVLSDEEADSTFTCTALVPVRPGYIEPVQKPPPVTTTNSAAAPVTSGGSRTVHQRTMTTTTTQVQLMHAPGGMLTAAVTQSTVTCAQKIIQDYKQALSQQPVAKGPVTKTEVIDLCDEEPPVSVPSWNATYTNSTRSARHSLSQVNAHSKPQRRQSARLNKSEIHSSSNGDGVQTRRNTLKSITTNNPIVIDDD